MRCFAWLFHCWQAARPWAQEAFLHVPRRTERTKNTTSKCVQTGCWEICRNGINVGIFPEGDWNGLLTTFKIIAVNGISGMLNDTWWWHVKSEQWSLHWMRVAPKMSVECLNWSERLSIFIFFIQMLSYVFFAIEILFYAVCLSRRYLRDVRAVKPKQMEKHWINIFTYVIA